MSLTKSLTFTKEDSAHNKPTIDDVLNAFNGLEHEGNIRYYLEHHI